jgi:hypothetical protein
MLVYVNGTKTNITELAQYKGAKKGLLKITDEGVVDCPLALALSHVSVLLHSRNVA